MATPLSVAIAYGASLAVFLALDLGRARFASGWLNRAQLGDWVLDRPSVPPTIVFYLLYVAGLVFFAVIPGLRAADWSVALLNGALFGVVAYLTYSLTNLAVLRGWTGLMAVSDIGWGAAMSAVAAVAGYMATRWTAL